MPEQVMYKIFEIKGILDSVVEMREYDDHAYDIPMIDRMQRLLNEIIDVTNVAGER